MKAKPSDFAVLRQVAERAAAVAGDLLSGSWPEPRQVREKGYRDLVTDADVAAQRLITDMIRTTFPEHGFLAEEADSSLPMEGPVVWIIDPIDGTSNFSRSLPDFSVSIAAAVRLDDSPSGFPRNYRPVVGVIHDPLRNETFSAALGQGSALNGWPISTSGTPSLSEAIVGLDWSRHYKKRQAAIDAVGAFAHQVHTIRAFGSAALGLAWVAAGRLDLYFNLGLGAWDVAAGLVLIGEAGGLVSNLRLEPWRLGDNGCLAGNRDLQVALHELIESSPDD